MKGWSFSLPAIIGAVGVAVFSAPNGLAEDLYTFHDEGGCAYYTNVPSPGRSKVRLPLKQAHLRKKAVDTQRSNREVQPKSDYGEAIQSACDRFTVDPHLVRAVIKAESNFDSGAVSSKGAIGLMQLMPDTAQDMGVSDPFDPVENINGGVEYLSRLLSSLNGDLSLALAAYNAGPERVKSYKGIPPFKETWNYIDRVMSYYHLFKGKDQL